MYRLSSIKKWSFVILFFTGFFLSMEMLRCSEHIGVAAISAGIDEQPLEKGVKKDIHFSSIRELSGIPFASKDGIVLNYKRLKISDVDQAYNPSIVAMPNGYLLAFRNDRGIGLERKSCLSAARLDSRFRQYGKTVFFHTDNPISEDPRCLSVNGQLFLLYCHVFAWYPYTTSMAMVQVDPEKLTLSGDVDLRYREQKIEKNWVPFVYSDQSGSDVYFVYSANPFKILRLSRRGDGGIEEPFPQSEKRDFLWESRWGKICGGTPAVEVNGEYLTFFHSSFWSHGVRWYVMGVYTFDNKPPFEIKRISRYPILFKKMYNTPIHPDVWFRPRKEFRVVFPGGFIEAKNNGKDVLHLVYGENDSGLCVLTLDKDRLLNSLQNIEAGITTCRLGVCPE